MDCCISSQGTQLNEHTQPLMTLAIITVSIIIFFILFKGESHLPKQTYCSNKGFFETPTTEGGLLWTSHRNQGIPSILASFETSCRHMKASLKVQCDFPVMAMPKHASQWFSNDLFVFLQLKLRRKDRK